MCRENRGSRCAGWHRSRFMLEFCSHSWALSEAWKPSSQPPQALQRPPQPLRDSRVMYDHAAHRSSSAANLALLHRGHTNPQDHSPLLPPSPDPTLYCRPWKTPVTVRGCLPLYPPCCEAFPIYTDRLSLQSPPLSPSSRHCHSLALSGWTFQRGSLVTTTHLPLTLCETSSILSLCSPSTSLSRNPFSGSYFP